MIPVPDRMPELDLAIKAAASAGDSIMEIYRTDFGSSLKEDDSPITEADLASNRIIKEILAKSGHYVLSEEDVDDEARLDEKTLWIVDPLDGTADFIDRTGEFTVMIALVWDGSPVLGVIGWPDGGKIYAAQRGRGAFRLADNKWEKISVSKISDVKSSRAVGSRHHLSDRERAAIKRLGIPRFEGVGSSLKACRIGSGEAEIYFTYTDRMSEWDSAASNCIITEAGGRMTDVGGGKLVYNGRNPRHRNGILATNGILHDRVRSGL